MSQRGARRLLYEFGVRNWEDIFDKEMGKWCAGTDVSPPSKDGKPEGVVAKAERKSRQEAQRKEERVCLTSQPPIIAHHHPENGESDIAGIGGGFARQYETKHIRWSVRMNLARLSRGLGWDGKGLVDQWPDD